MPELVNVPDVDGVPAVLFAPGAGTGIVLAAADAVGLPFLGTAPQWGIFLNGQPVVTADTTLAFDYKKDYSIADYPLEKGAFESYNKVEIPFDVRFIYTAGGSEANRADLLTSLEEIEGDLNLYEAVTPEKVYPNVNVIHVDYHRTSQNGVGLLVVSVFCQEIRQTTSAGTPSSMGAIGETASASGADQINSGAVQATDVGTQPNATSTLANNAPNTVAEPLTGTNATATELPLTANVTATPIDGTTIGNASVMLPEQSVTAPQTSSSISGLQAAGPDQYSLFGVSP